MDRPPCLHTHTHTHRIIILQLFFLLTSQSRPHHHPPGCLSWTGLRHSACLLYSAYHHPWSQNTHTHTHTHTNRVSSDGECGHLAHTILLYTCLAIKRHGTYTHSSVHKPIPVRDTCDNECALTQCIVHSISAGVQYTQVLSPQMVFSPSVGHTTTTLQLYV